MFSAGAFEDFFNKIAANNVLGFSAQLLGEAEQCLHPLKMLGIAGFPIGALH
ncbi:hypothetical protein D3C80_2217770 [compost metagenome]